MWRLHFCNLICYFSTIPDHSIVLNKLTSQSILTSFEMLVHGYRLSVTVERWGEVRWIDALRHFSTMFGYIWRSVSTAGGTHCSWEWTSTLPLATDNYLSWDSNPRGEGRVVSKRDALTTRPRRPLLLKVSHSYCRKVKNGARLLLFHVTTKTKRLLNTWRSYCCFVYYSFFDKS